MRGPRFEIVTMQFHLQKFHDCFYKNCFPERLSSNNASILLLPKNAIKSQLLWLGHCQILKMYSRVFAIPPCCFHAVS